MAPDPAFVANRLSRRLFAGLLVAGCGGLAFGAWRGLQNSDLQARAQDFDYLRIGTGDVGGVYFRIGSVLANMISDPQSLSDCDGDGPCGVPGMVAVAQSSGGSVDNVAAMERGALEAGLCQSDVAYWAFNGEELFGETGRHALRFVANLYNEAVHIVVRADDETESIDGLRGRPVVVGARGSGSLVGARIILGSYGLDLEDIVPVYENITRGVALLASGEADAVFVTSGAPTPSLLPLADGPGFRLLEIDDDHAATIQDHAPFFTRLRIPRDQYPGVGDIRTLAVGAQLLVRADLDDTLVFDLTRALWHPSNRTVLNNGHPIGQRISLATALTGATVPIHPGAQRLYESLGQSIDPSEDEPGEVPMPDGDDSPE